MIRPAVAFVVLCSLGSAFAAEPDAKAEAVAKQKKLSEERWQALVAGRPVTHKETDNFLFYTTLEEKDLEPLVKAAEKTLAQVKKLLKIEPADALWDGKLIVNVFNERVHYAAYVRRFDKRSPDDDESGSYIHEREYSAVTAGQPARTIRSYTLSAEVVRLVGIATLTKKSKYPEWFVSGFGRSLAYRHTPNQFSTERARAAALVRQGKTAQDIWTGNLAASEGFILHASFVDYLINGPNMAKSFPDVLSNFGDETPFEDALKNAKLVPDRVNAGWRAWALTVR